jgi:hypothetical protein
LGLPQDGEYFRFGCFPALDLRHFARVEVGLVFVERAREVVADEHRVPEVESLSPRWGDAANQRGSTGRVGVAQTRDRFSVLVHRAFAVGVAESLTNVSLRGLPQDQ